ncbi:MAG: ferrochelatase [Pseudomonadota bacterium]|nr:ferrochelatase [Pseudomonadota bacterium]
MSIGVLLVNLGTPASTDLSSVRSYLREFLSDARVIDLPILIRYLLLYLFILPFRPKLSQAAYKKIWFADGSPLRVYGDKLTKKVATKLGDDYKVVLAMRYGDPSIEAGLNSLKDCDRIIVLSLFPQYASATSGSVNEKIFKILSEKQYIQPVNFLPEFYNSSGFVGAYSEQLKKSINGKEIDKVIFSFHGLPVRHIEKSGCAYVCKAEQPCPSISESNKVCYRAQCYETAKLISERAGINREDYVVSFQSRLGKTPWITPYTDDILESLSKQHEIKNIAVICPSFVADCLETLEEIGMEAKEDWLKLGGKDFTLVPCLNDNSTWVDALCILISNG